jgi:hypothetical protein
MFDKVRLNDRRGVMAIVDFLESGVILIGGVVHVECLNPYIRTFGRWSGPLRPGVVADHPRLHTREIGGNFPLSKFDDCLASLPEPAYFYEASARPCTFPRR